MSLDKALKLLRSKRPIVSPNSSFLKQLKELGEEITLEEAEAKTAAEETFVPN